MHIRNFRTKRPSKKLDHVKEGLFRIIRVVSLVNYELRLPKNMHIHLVFYVLLLELALLSTKEVIVNIEVEIKADPKFEVERILDVYYFDR